MEIVKYNNDFNLLNMPKLSATQLNFLMVVLSQIAEKSDREKPAFQKQSVFNSEQRTLEMDFVKFWQLAKNDNYKLSSSDIERVWNDFAEKLLHSVVHYKDERVNYSFVCFESCLLEKSTNQIKIKMQESFYNMIVNYKLGFTKFELLEFNCLVSMYAKRLYQHLRQFKNTGVFVIDWDNFKRLLQIPKGYKMCEIDSRVLKPAVQELSAERTLFDQNRIPFDKLRYEKIKGKGRGRGGNIVAVKFKWQVKDLRQLSAQTPETRKMIKESKELSNLRVFVGRHFANEVGEYSKIVNFSANQENNSIHGEFKNCETNQRWSKTFESKKHLKAWLNKIGLLELP